MSVMKPAELRKVMDEWVNQIEDLGKRHMWVQIFENRGKMVGCSNPHPHCQVINNNNNNNNNNSL